MSLLAKKMDHGSPLVLSWPVIRSKALLQNKGPRNQKHEASVSLKNIYLIYLFNAGEPNTTKTAWEHYNEGTYPATSPHIT